jgi:hypothetical protein
MNQIGKLQILRSGPFTDEHVVSAGFGGDDKAWFLKDCVCSDCIN